MNAEASGNSRAGGDRISRNAVFAFAAQMSTAAFTAVLTVFLSRQLGPAAFGTLALAVSIAGLLRRASAGAMSQAAARFIAERHGDPVAITGVLGMALRIRLVTAAGLALALFVLAGPIADLFDTQDLVWPLRGVAVAMFGQSVVTFVNNVFVALRRTSGSFTLVISESAMEFTASVALVLLGAGATGAAFGRAIGYAFGAILGVLLLGRLLGRSPLFRTGRSGVGRREFANYAGAMLVLSSSAAVFSQLDVLLIGGLLTTAAVGIYSAPLQLISVLGYPSYAVAQGVAPRLARRSNDPPNVGALSTALSYVVILQAGFVAVLLVWAEPIVRLTLGAEFLESAEVIRALTPFVFLAGISNLLAQPLNYAGEGKRRIPLSIAMLIVAVGLDLLLIPEIGVLGAAVGTDVAYALYVGGHLWLAHRILSLPLKPLASSFVRSLVAALALAGALALVGTGELSVLGWVAGAVGGSAVFCVGLLTTRALSLQELRSLLRVPASVLRSG